MSKPLESNHWIVVESFESKSTSGLHGEVHVRPTGGQVFDQSLYVRRPKEMTDTSRYELGTRFRIKVKLTDKKGSKPFLHAPHQWKFFIANDETDLG